MAWEWYLNMEPLALQIAQENLEHMTNDNYDKKFPDEFYLMPNDEAFESNLRHGFIVIVMMACYFESSLNTILRDFLKYRPDGELIKSNEGTKLELIFNDREEELGKIKSTANWRDAHRILRMRNHLMHYKDNSAARCASWPPISAWKIGNEVIGDFFTKSTLTPCVNAVQNLISMIAEAIGLKINPISRVIGGGGRFPAASCFCTEAEHVMICEELSRPVGSDTTARKTDSQ